MFGGKDEETEFRQPELLHDILRETEEGLKLFVTPITSAVRQAHGLEPLGLELGAERRSRRAEKKQKLPLNVWYRMFAFPFDLPKADKCLLDNGELNIRCSTFIF